MNIDAVCEAPKADGTPIPPVFKLESGTGMLQPEEEDSLSEATGGLTSKERGGRVEYELPIGTSETVFVGCFAKV